MSFIINIISLVVLLLSGAAFAEPSEDTKKYMLKSIAFYSKYTNGDVYHSEQGETLPDFPYIEGNAARSYCFSAKFDSSNAQCLLSTGYPSDSAAFNIKMGIDGSTHIGVMGYNNDHYPKTGSVIGYDIMTWNNYCVTFDGETITIYVNGIIDNTIHNKNSLNTKGVSAGQTNYIGKSNHMAAVNPFSGYMKNIRLFAKMLSQNEVQLLNDDDNNNSNPGLDLIAQLFNDESYALILDTFRISLAGLDSNDEVAQEKLNNIMSDYTILYNDYNDFNKLMVGQGCGCPHTCYGVCILGECTGICA